MSQLKYDCPWLVQVLAVRAEEFMGTAKSQKISNAHLGYFKEEIFEHIGKHANVVVGNTTQAISNTLWALSISGLISKHEETIRMLWDEAMKKPVSE